MGAKDKGDRVNPKSEGKPLDALQPNDSPGGKHRKPKINEPQSGTIEALEKDIRHEQWITIGLTAAIALVGFLQLCVFREQLRVQKIVERAWVNIIPPANFPLDGAFIPVAMQIVNSGKTPAKEVQGDIIATILRKGEAPNFDYGLGHPHNRIYTGVIFPNGPLSSTIPIVRYGPMTPEVIVPTPELRQELASGQSFIIVHGKITYTDTFGVQHWTKFCTGMAAPLIDFKDCIRYNDVDDNK